MAKQNVHKKKAKGFKSKTKKGTKKISSLMNNKIASLSKSDDFKSLIKGKKINNKYLIIFFKKLSDKNNNVLNISFVTKRKIGKAIVRNKIKRRLRNLMNEAVKKLNLNLNYSYLFIAKKNIVEDQYDLIKQNLFEDLKKIK